MHKKKTKRPIAYLEVPRRLTVPIKIGYKPSSSKIQVINKSRLWKTRRKSITTLPDYQSLPSKQSADPCWKRPTRISVLSRWDKLNLALTSLKSRQENAVEIEPERRGTVVQLLRKLTLPERDRESKHSKESKSAKEQDKVERTTKKEKAQKPEQPPVVTKVEKLKKPKEYSVVSKEPKKEAVKKLKKSPVVTKETKEGVVKKQKEPSIISKEPKKKAVKKPKESPVVTKETKEGVVKKQKEPSIISKEPKKEAVKKPKESPVVTKETKKGAVNKQNEPSIPSKETKKDAVKKLKEPLATTPNELKKPAELTVIHEKRKLRKLVTRPEVMKTEDVMKPKDHTMTSEKETIWDKPSIVSLTEFLRKPEKSPVVVMAVKVKKSNKKVSAKPITKVKTVTVKKTDHKDTLSYRFVNCFYRVCCQVFCYLSCLVIIGLIMIVAFF